MGSPMAFVFVDDNEVNVTVVDKITKDSLLIVIISVFSVEYSA